VAVAVHVDPSRVDGIFSAPSGDGTGSAVVETGFGEMGVVVVVVGVASSSSTSSWAREASGTVRLCFSSGKAENVEGGETGRPLERAFSEGTTPLGTTSTASTAADGGE